MAMAGASGNDIDSILTNFETDLVTEERNRWQAISEEHIFLQDGLLFSVGLIPNPVLGAQNEMNSSQSGASCDLDGFLAADTKDLSYLSPRILRVCTRSILDIQKVHEHEFSILLGMWRWKAWYLKNIAPQTTQEGLHDDEQNHAISKGSNGITKSNLRSKLGMLLIIPLLKSHASLDRELAAATTNLLYDMLSNLEPMSLYQEFDKPLEALEDLLLEWIAQKTESLKLICPSTLIALACSRGVLQSFLKTFELLLSTLHLNLSLPLRNVLRKFAKMRLRIGEPSSIQASKYMYSFPYDDKINILKKPKTSNPERPSLANTYTGRPLFEDHNKISLTLQKGFLYMSGARGQGLCKVGSGNEGTIQGHVYATNPEIKAGNLASGDKFILARDQHLDAQIVLDKGVVLAETLNHHTLRKTGIVFTKLEDDLPGPYITIGLTSDGRYFYLLRAPLNPDRSRQDRATVPSNGKPVEPAQLQVFLDTFEVVECDIPDVFFAKSKMPRIPLNRNADLDMRFSPPPTGNDAIISNFVADTVRIMHSNAVQGPRTAEETFKHHNTSLGIDLSDLLKSTIFCCGNYLTLLINYEGMGIAQFVMPATGVQVLIRQLTGLSDITPPGKGTQLHIYIVEGTVQYSKQDLKDLPESCSFIKGAPRVQLGACYDFKNNMIWTSNGQFVDMWKSPGHTPNWLLDSQQLIYRNDYLLEGSNMELETAKILNILMTHVGRMASHFISGHSDCNIGFKPDYIIPVVNIMKSYGNKLDASQLGSLLLVLQAQISQIKAASEEAQSGINEIKSVLWLLIDTCPVLQLTWSTNKDDPVIWLYRQIGKIYGTLFEHSTEDTTESLLRELDFSPDKNSRKQDCLILVQFIVLEELTMKFRELNNTHHFANKWIISSARMATVLEASVESTIFMFEKEISNVEQEIPVSVIETQYLSAVTNYFLETWSRRDVSIPKPLMHENLTEFLKELLSSCTRIVERATSFISLNVLEKRLSYMENVLKSSLLGFALPQVLLFFTSDLYKDGVMIDSLSEEVLHLCKSLSFLTHKVNCDDMARPIGLDKEEDWSSQFKKPSIWHSKLIESDHPLKENSKIKETVTIPNARRLYIKFDGRCSTHSEYDKFSLFSGTGDEVRYINDYGGTVTRAGNGVSRWPTHLVQIDGPEFTYWFETKSARDRNISESTIWGFAFTVYPVYDYAGIDSPKLQLTTEKVPNEMCFVNKLALCSLDGFNSLVLTMLENSDFPASMQVKVPETFLSNHFLTTFNWITVVGSGSYTQTPAIPKDLFSKLLIRANIRDFPNMRSQMTNVIKPGLFQRLFVTACLRSLFHEKNSSENVFEESLLNSIHPDVIREIFRQVTVILRKLVSLLEMQFRFNQEIQDIINKIKPYDDAFFNSATFLESEIDILNLTTLLNISPIGNGQKIIHMIYSVVDSYLADNGKAELTRADELVKEAHLKCMYLITAERKNEFKRIPVGHVKASKEIVGSISHFIASHLNNTEDSTLLTLSAAIKQSEQKSLRQCKGLRLLLGLLEKSQPYSQLVLSSAFLLHKLDIFQDSLSVTGLERELGDYFGQGIKAIVKIAETNVQLYRYSVLLLCILPYKRSDEQSLVKSELLALLDKLCALQKSEHSETTQSSFSLAWGAFQILAARCSSWQTAKLIYDEESLALPVQISKNVANHLTRATLIVEAPCKTMNGIDSFSQLNRTNTLTLTESIQDVLLLLDSLRETNLGRTILKQSLCTCRLLSLLQDPRLSPRLTHVILRLLRTALPITEDLNVDDLAETTTFVLKRSLVPGHSSLVSPGPTSHYIVVGLLISKLADFLICANQHPTPNNCSKCPEYESQSRTAVWIHKRPEQTHFSENLSNLFNLGQGNGLHPLIETLGDMEIALAMDTKVKVLVDNANIAQQKAIQLAQMGFLISLETLNPMLVPRQNESTGGVLGSSQASTRTRQDTCDHIGKERNFELVTLDAPRHFLSGEVAEGLAAEIIELIHALLTSSDESTRNYPRASSPSAESFEDSPEETETSNFTNTTSSKPVTPRPDTSRWATAVEQTLCSSLKVLPKLSLIGNPIGKSTPLDSYGYSARLAIASLSILGSFAESIRADSEVWIGPDCTMHIPDNNQFEDNNNLDFVTTPARVISVNKNKGSAIVEALDNSIGRFPSRNLEVPLSRLTLRKDGNSFSNISKILSPVVRQDICRYLRYLFTPSSSITSTHIHAANCPIKKQLPTLSQIFSTATAASSSSSNTNTGDAKTLAHVSEETSKTASQRISLKSMGMTVVRLVAEIRTRAAQVLSIWLKNREFADLFLGYATVSDSEDVISDHIGTQECLGALNVLKRLGLECKPSHRLESLQAQVTRLRLLYRDCTKPPKLLSPNQSSSSKGTHFQWDYTRLTPLVRNCAFRNDFTGVTFAGEPSSGAGNPRGVLLFSKQKVPTSGFYFELQIMSIGDSTNDSSASFSFGFSPLAGEQRRDGASSGAWQYPLGGVMFHSTGRFVHYVGSSLLSWKSEKVNEYSVKVGDTIGMGWEPMPSRGGMSAQSDPIPILRPRHASTPLPQPTNPRFRVVRERLSNTEASSRSARGPAGSDAGPSAPIVITPGSTSLKGYAFLTLNGQRLNNRMENVDTELWPCLHLQKTNVSTDANFGAKPFLFVDGRKPAVIEENSMANQVNRFFASSESESSGPSVSGGALQRISESLQDLGVHFGNLTFYPLLEEDEDSDSDSSFADAETGTDSISESASPLSSQTHISLSAAELNEGHSALELDSDASEETIQDLVIAPAHSNIHALPTVPTNISRNPDVVRRSSARGIFKATIEAKEKSEINEQGRVAVSDIESKDYASACLLDYNLPISTSFDIRVFSGSNRYFCPCTDKNESELEAYMIDDSDVLSSTTAQKLRSKASDLGHIEGEDIHNLLVRAWETRVFPTIRRRFRNETERRDGLEQIRGALQLGMIDIARQTVEFLYEEGNGIPRDLHFPTLDEIRIEASRFTLEKIHPGETVNIKSLTRDANDELILPKYSLPAMLRTFGLTGEVLAVDTAHELLLVETYVESEGVLLRFWYPLKDLEKPTSIAKAQLNSSTINMFKLHSNLVNLESMLCRIYCRQAFLQILEANSYYRSNESLNLSKNGTENVASGLTCLFQELDLENLQIRSEDNFAAIPGNGDLLTRNLECGMPSMEFLADVGNPSYLFYKDSKKLSRDLKCAISRALSQGDDYLHELTNQICQIMKETPSKFVTDTVPLDKEGSFTISLPDVAFTALAFSGPQTEKNLAAVRSILQPCLHIYGYSGGDSKKYPLACFPIQPTHSLHKENPANRTNGSVGTNSNKTRMVPLPHILVPVDKLFCSITSAALKENSLEVQGIPSQFPLALLYSQHLIDFVRNNETISRSSVSNLVCIFANFLDRITLLPLIKEWIFSILSEAVNLLKTEPDLLWEFYLAQSALIRGLFKELLVGSRWEKEKNDSVKLLLKSSRRPTNSPTINSSGSQAGTSRQSRLATSAQELNMSDKVRSLIVTICSVVHSKSITKAVKPNDLIDRLLEFPVLSSYMQMLTELCMSLFYVVQLFTTPESRHTSPYPSPIQSPSRKTSSAVQSPIARSIPATSNLPTNSGTAYISRKNVLTRNTESRFRKETITPVKITKQRRILSFDVSTKMIDVLDEIRNGQPSWFSSAYITCQILKSLVWSEKTSPNIEILSTFILEATSAMQTSTNHSRLVVICDAPNNIHEMPLETSLIHALNESGGVFGQNLWISDNLVDVVVEIRSLQKTDKAIEILKRNQTWYPIEDFILYPAVTVYSVNNNLETENKKADQVLKTYLTRKIYDTPEQDKFCSKAEDVFSHLFTSCYISSADLFTGNELGDEETILLEDKHLLNLIEGNLMEKFIIATKPSELEVKEFLKMVLRKFGQPNERTNLDAEAFRPFYGVLTPVPEKPTNNILRDQKSKSKKLNEPSSFPSQNVCLSLEGFMNWTLELGKENICALWKGLFATGYDIRLDKTWISERTAMVTYMTNGEWTKAHDNALVMYIDRFGETLRVPPQVIHPHEIYFEESDYLNPAYQVLQGIPIERVRTRCAMLQLLNLLVSKNVLPYVPLHLGQSMKFSTTALLRDAQHILFYHLKDEFLYKVLQFSSLRTGDTLPPECILNEFLEGPLHEVCSNTMFSAVLTQLNNVSSALLASKPATGGDPPLPMIVKFAGEEVHGLIGSFRHFLSNAVADIKSPALQLLIKCPSSDAGRNKDSWIVRPGPLTFGEEKLLRFFGQFIGICIRVDAPISCTIFSNFWESFVASTNDLYNQTDDLQEIDVLTSSFLNTLQSVESEEEFNKVLEQTDHPRFVYLSMDHKSMIPLCLGGEKLSVSWNTRDQFIELVKQFRLKEIKSVNRMNYIFGGLATLLPTPAIVNLFSPRHMELRVSGSPDINLPLLKAHTHYHVGISETDLHILFFWSVLEAMTPVELKDFIKFASNQERLPATCPCQNQSAGTNLNSVNLIHVPPFPMKIAAPIDIPPDASQDYINKRTIRAETCLFLIRLPPYSSYQVTRQQILFASNSRDDPLSG